MKRRTHRRRWPRTCLGLTGLITTGSTLPGALEASAEPSSSPPFAGPTVAAPFGLSAVSSAVTLGIVGDGKPDFIYDPLTGDLTFSPDGAHFTTTGGVPSFVSALTVASLSGDLLFNNVTPTYKLGVGATLTPTLISSAITNSPGFSDGTTLFDIGNVLPLNLDASVLTSDLTVKYQSLNGGSLKLGSLIIINGGAGGGGTITASSGTSLSAAGDLLFTGTAAGTVFPVTPGQAYPSPKNIFVTNNTTLTIQGGVVSTASNYATFITPGAAIVMSGGALVTGSVSNAGSFTFTGGTLALTASDLVFDAGQLFGATATLSAGTASAGNIALRPGAAVHITGATLSTIRALTIDPGATLHLDGGAVRAGSIAGGGSLLFSGGSLQSAAPIIFDIGQPLGPTLTLASGTISAGGFALGSTADVDLTGPAAFMSTTGAVTINGGALLRISGGTLNAGSLTGAGTLDFQSGSLLLGSGKLDLSQTINLTNGTLSAPFAALHSGANITLSTGGALTTAYAVTLESGSLLRVSGGALQAGSLSTTSGGSFDFRSGTVSLTLGNLTLTRGSAGDADPIAIGDNLHVGDAVHAGTLRFGGSGIATIVQTGGSVSATTIDLGAATGSYVLAGGSFSASTLLGQFTLLGGSASINSMTGPLTVGDGATAASFTLTNPLVAPSVHVLANSSVFLSPKGTLSGTSGVVSIDPGALVRISGGALRAGSLIGSVDFRSGTVAVTTGDLTLTRGGPGDTTPLAAGDNLSAGGALHFAGGTAAASITQNGGSIAANVIDIGGPAGTYILSGGTLSASLLPAGQFTLNAAAHVKTLGNTLTLGDGVNPVSLSIAAGSSENSVTAPILRLQPSATVSLTSGGFLWSTAVVTLDSSALLRVSGGSLKFGSLGGAGTLDFRSGTVVVTAGDLTLTRGSPTDLAPISAGDSISVSGTLRFGGTGLATVTQTGGFVSANIIDLGGPAGAYAMTGGNLTTNAIFGTLSVFGGSATVAGSNSGGINVGVPGAPATLTLGGPTGMTTAIKTPSITIAESSSLIFAPAPTPLRNSADQITLAPTAALDIGNHELITSTPLATIRSYLIRSYDPFGNQDWAQPGITSSLARADSNHYTLGYAFGSDALNPRPDVPAGKVLIAPVPVGDVNMDGKTDFADIVRLARAGKYNTNQPANYTDGDIDYTGKVDIFDLLTLLTNWPGETAAGIAPTGTPSPLLPGLPTLAYNPLTGDLRFQPNNVTAPIATIMFWSLSGSFQTQNLSSSAQAETFVLRADQIDLAALNGLWMPDGSLDLGPVLPTGSDPATLISNLTYSYQVTGQDPVRLGSVATPEPSSGLLAAFGAVAGMLARRRRRRR
jgi:hypothetical protein